MAAEAHAARLHDPVAHSHALTGFLAGAAVGFLATLEAAALIGAVVGAVALEVGTAGLATPLVIGVGATVAEVGLTMVAGGLLTGAAEEEGEKLGSENLGDPTGAVAEGSPDVLINGIAAARATDQETCHSGKIAQGSQTVGINGLAAARVGDKTTCGAVIAKGSPDVVIGGPTGTFLGIQSEVSSGARLAVLIATIVVSFGAAAREIGPILSEISETGLARTLQTGAKALKTSLEEKGGGGTGPLGRQVGGASSTEVAVARMPAEFQGQYAEAEAANWKKPDGSTWYPPNNGGVGNPVQTEIPPKTDLDRYGSNNGSYLSNAGDSFESRALPGTPTGPANQFTTLQPTPAEQSEIAPWFGQPGGGTQYRLISPDGSGEPYSVQKAIFDGYMVQH